MAETVPVPITCPKCSAPLGVGDRRCPFCGFELPTPISVRPASRSSVPPTFEAATIGLTAHNEAQRSSQAPASMPPGSVRPPMSGPMLLIPGPGRPIQVVQAPPTRFSVVALVGAVAAAGLLGGLGWLAYQSSRPVTAPPVLVVQPRKAPQVPAVMSSIGSVAVADADRADPTESLARVQRTVAPDDPGAQLVSITVAGSRMGTVDLRAPGPSVTYVYALGRPATATLAPKGQPLAGREGRQLVLRAGGGQPEPATLAKGAAAVPEPLCVWSAAWRSAVKGGLPEDEVVDGVYAIKNDEPRWTVSVAGKPELSRDIDGKTCAIKTR